jgi:phosphomannomutase/phosphoglucomutase
MMLGQKTLSGADIQDLKRRVHAIAERGESAERGVVVPFAAREAYIRELIERSKTFVNPARKLKVVVDGGNGVGGLVGPEVLRGLGCEVIELYTDPDGRFPNHHPDPTVLENIEELRHRVVAEKADLGIAWDGDADRIGVVDERGEPLFGDMLMIIYGRQLLKEKAKPIIIGDVKCSELLFSDLKNRGAETVMAKTGHSLIKAKLKELHADLAGEMSGHIFFAHRYFGFDDALHSSARLIEIVSHATTTVSGLLADLPKMYSTPEIRVDCPEELKFEVAERAKELFPEFGASTIDGVRIQFPKGWGLVRASNTQPVLVMRFEAESEPLLSEYQAIVEGRIHTLTAELAGGR